MELLTSYFHQGVSFVVPLVILLGLLIFVHELGHFSVAKFFGVRVEVFSLGFGKKIISFRRGDTEYCVSIIPLGGYVKMFGDDPKAPIPDDQKAYSFNHKPVWPRIAIVLAGPLMNLVFAFVLFAIISMVGESVLLPVIGDVQTKSKAYEAGFRSGDTIVSVNGYPIAKWDEFDSKVKDSPEKPLAIQVKHLGTDKVDSIQATPELAPNKNILSDLSHVGEIEGVTYVAKASSVGLLDPTSLAGVAGFETGDVIVKLNGVETDRWMDLERVALAHKNDSSFKFEVERGENMEKKTFEIPIADVSKAKSGEEVLEKLGMHSPDLFISNVLPGSAAGEAGILKGDKIISVNGTALREWSELVGKVRSFEEKNKVLKVVVLRKGVERTFDVAPKKIKQMNNTGKEEENFAIGIVPSIVSAIPLTTIEKTSDPIKAVGIGVTNSWQWTKTICISFLRLFQARVSPKSIGGPIMIGQLASETFKVGLSPFLKIMAIISINLFVLNLLPVPVLDGGHLVFFGVEALRGAPLSIQKMEMAQQVGLVLLLGLMVLALFNDITRLIGL
jgi:regulator of sigma E protease